MYMILVQRFSKINGVMTLIDNWYLKDTVYPGTLTFENYNDALVEAETEMCWWEREGDKTTKHEVHVVLCHEYRKPKEIK